MSMTWLLTNLVAALLLPPLSLVLLGLCGLFVARRYSRRIGNSISLLAVALLVIFSTSAGSRLLIKPLEQRAVPLASPQDSKAQAIVILGGGKIRAAPEEQGRDQPGHQTLFRLRYGAQLHRITALPILVSGGSPDGGAESEADLMARALHEDFRVPVRWVEGASDNTAENALRSAAQLNQAGVNNVLLVTDAMHMTRASAIFRKTGLIVTPAPTGFVAQNPLRIDDFIPNAGALRSSHYALHEWIGLLWYRLRHGSDL